jgi:hypothetical protein
MTDQQISAMTAGTPTATDTFPFQRGGMANYQASGSALGAGTILLPYVAPGTSGNVLTSNGSAWTSAAAAGGIEYSTNDNDIFRLDSAGASGWTGTINGAPSGAVVTYTNVSGNKNTLVSASTSQIAKQRLYNTTRGNYGLISTSNGSTTITLTQNAPADWANGDTITTLSPTVNQAGWVDLEFVSGISDSDTGIIGQFFILDSAAANKPARVHPFEAYVTSKIQQTYTQVANVYMTGVFFIKLSESVFSCYWGLGTSSDTGTFALRILAEF